MALTFSEGVAVATLVFTILAVLFVVPYVLVAFGFFPDSGFARRVHPSNSAILAELAAMRKDIETLRKNSDFELEWSEIQTDILLTIGEKLKEKMD
ncbi:hypothetical protein V8E51_001662 [Hyaloscypha variabilis]